MMSIDSSLIAYVESQRKNLHDKRGSVKQVQSYHNNSGKKQSKHKVHSSDDSLIGLAMHNDSSEDIGLSNIHDHDGRESLTIDDGNSINNAVSIDSKTSVGVSISRAASTEDNGINSQKRNSQEIRSQSSRKGSTHRSVGPIYPTAAVFGPIGGTQRSQQQYNLCLLNLKYIHSHLKLHHINNLNNSNNHERKLFLSLVVV